MCEALPFCCSIRAEVVVDELDDSEDDEEEMGAGAELAAGSGAISTAVSQKVLAQKAAQV